MTKRERGTITLTVDGKVYTLALDINALCLLEERHSTPEKQVSFEEVLRDMLVNRKRLTAIREVVWAALQTHHPGMTEEEAGDLMQACGGIAGFAEQIGALVETAQPDARDVKELGADSARPRRAQADRKAGTGGRSISTPAPLV